MAETTRDELFKLARACAAVGRWLSAAQDDPKVCAEMKRDIKVFFENYDPAKYANLEDCEQIIRDSERAAQDTEYVGPKVNAPKWWWKNNG